MQETIQSFTLSRVRLDTESPMAINAAIAGTALCLLWGLRRMTRRQLTPGNIDGSNEIVDVDPGPLLSFSEIKEKPICIIGAGSIGASFCTVWLGRGKHVICIDPFVEREALEARIRILWPAMIARGFSTKKEPPFELLRFYKENSQAIQEAGFIQECTIEDIDFKQKYLKELDDTVDPRVIIASSSSFISSDVSTKFCTRNPHRVIIGHPTVPHLENFMEIHSKASRVISVAKEFYRDSGFDVIVMRKPVPGHVYNMFLSTSLRLAHSLVADGTCTPEDVNTAMRHFGRDLYARNGYLALMTTVGGREGHRGGRKLITKIRDAALPIITFTRLQESGWPERLAKSTATFLVNKFGDVVLPPPPEAFFDASARFEDEITNGGKLEVETALLDRIDRPAFNTVPYEVDKDPFRLEIPSATTTK